MPRRPKKESRPHSRPLKPIDWEMVDKYLMAGSPGTEIAAIFDMHPKTFYDRCLIEKGVIFTEYCLSKRSTGKAALRLKQFHSAMNGEVAMLKHLGEFLLDQIRGKTQPDDFSKLDEILSHVADLSADKNEAVVEEQKTEEDEAE